MPDLNSFSWPLEDASVELSVLSARIVRVRLSFAGEQPSGFKVALPFRDESQAVDSDGSTITTPELSISLPELVFRGADGEPFLHSAGFSWERVDHGRRRVMARFRRASEEHYYGLGQWGPGLDKDGATRRLWNSHYGYGPGTDMAVPLVISSRGYGLFFDNSWDAEVALGRNDTTNTLAYTAEGGELDVYVVYGPRPRTILEEYANLTGRPPMPPRWALGYIQSTRHFDSADEIVELAQTLRDKQVPCDVIVFLSTYGDDMGMNNGVGTLEFHPRLWADSEGLVRDLSERNLHVVSHEYPVVSPKSARFEEARRRGFLLDHAGSERSVMFNEGQRYLDFSNPEAAAWWWDAHAELIEAGVDGWWLDGGEGPPADVALRAGSGRALHNVFDFFRQQAFAEGERRTRPDRRHWLLCRSGYAGMQRLGSATWSGDINNTFGVFEAQLALGLSTAMSGVPYWGTDIGGFFHTVPESPELFVRWFQFAAFCPLFRSHGRGIGKRGWREHLPWAHGPEIEAICRAFSDLRYRLFPYNYSLAWEAHTRGIPPMRPLVLEFPDDANVVDMASEYMWGPSLLVAPVTRGGARHWPVYLPRGAWFDYWTGEQHAGERWIEADAPLDRLPLFVRAGAVIPLGPPMQYLQASDAPIRLLVYPDGESHFVLYEDDGISRGYERGEYTLTDIHNSGTTLRVARSGLSGLRQFVAQLPSGATIDWTQSDAAQTINL